MSKLTWDNDGERFYETGIENVVLYPKGTPTTTGGTPYVEGFAWNGVTALSVTPEGGEPEDLYADNIKYLSLFSPENTNASITAYTYPDQFAECDGTAKITGIPGLEIKQQTRKLFGLCFKTRVGNDEDGDQAGYKLHLLYNCMASPSEKEFATINDSPEAIEFSWDLTTTPVEVTYTTSGGDVTKYKPTAYLVIDSRTANATKLAALEEMLYGTDGSGSETGTTAQLPLPSVVISTLAAS